MTHEELVEKIKGELAAKAEAGKETVARAQAQAAQEIDELLRHYQDIVEALPISLLDIVEKGGYVDIKVVDLGDADLDEHIDLWVETSRHHRGRDWPRLSDLPQRQRYYRVVLVAMPIEGRDAKRR